MSSNNKEKGSFRMWGQTISYSEELDTYLFTTGGISRRISREEARQYEFDYKWAQLIYRADHYGEDEGELFLEYGIERVGKKLELSHYEVDDLAT